MLKYSFSASVDLSFEIIALATPVRLDAGVLYI